MSYVAPNSKHILPNISKNTHPIEKPNNFENLPQTICIHVAFTTTETRPQPENDLKVPNPAYVAY